MNRNETPVWPEHGATPRPEITPEVLDAAMIRARKLRAQHASSLLDGAIALIGAALGWIRAGVRKTLNGRPGHLRQVP